VTPSSAEGGASPAATGAAIVRHYPSGGSIFSARASRARDALPRLNPTDEHRDPTGGRRTQ
jgi:hypothetical protein